MRPRFASAFRVVVHVYFSFLVSALQNETLAALQQKVAATVRTQARNGKGPWQGEEKRPEKSQRVKE